MKISGSRIQTWQRCHRTDYFRNNLGYTTAHDSESIQMGNWGHYTLGLAMRGFDYEEAIIRTINRQTQLWEQFGVEPDPEKYLAQVKKFTNLMKAHEQWQRGSTHRYNDDNLQVICTEKNFEIPYYNHVITGQWDALVKLKQTGEHFVFERKITKYPEQLELAVQWDIQPRLYVWAAKQLLGLDIKVTGMLYEFIRNCDPYDVKMLQNGYPSKAKTELDGTDYETYLNVLYDCDMEHAAGSNNPIVEVTEKYKDQLDYLKNKAKPIFRRTVLPVPLDHQKIAVATARKVATEIGKHRHVRVSTYSPTLSRYHCASNFTPCAYRDACLAMDDGADWLELLDNTFVQDKPHFDEGINDEQ
jgi:hypothetical protein